VTLTSNYGYLNSNSIFLKALIAKNIKVTIPAYNNAKAKAEI